MTQLEELLEKVHASNMKITFERDDRGFHCDIIKYRAGSLTSCNSGIAIKPLKALELALQSMVNNKK